MMVIKFGDSDKTVDRPMVKKVCVMYRGRAEHLAPEKQIGKSIISNNLVVYLILPSEPSMNMNVPLTLRDRLPVNCYSFDNLSFHLTYVTVFLIDLRRKC